MSKRDPALRETVKIVIGEAAVTALICIVSALIDRFTLPVLWGALYGSVLNILYFFLLCIGVNRTLDRAAGGENNQTEAKKNLTVSYLVRLVLLGVGLAVGFKCSLFHNIALVIPVLMTRPILTAAAVFEKKEVK